MKNEEILMKILEELKMGEEKFIDSIISGEMIEAGILLGVNFIALIILIVLFKKFNTTFYIKENINKLLEIFTSVLKRDECKPKNTSEKEFNEIDFFNEINKWLNNHKLWRNIGTFIVVWIEFKWIIAVIGAIVRHFIVLINCYYAPEKILMDYLSSLF